MRKGLLSLVLLLFNSEIISLLVILCWIIYAAAKLIEAAAEGGVL